MYFQSLRIIPIDWKQSISLKVSVRGCDTLMPSKYFNGNTTIPATNLDINETLDIKIGFKTFESNGILLRYVIKKILAFKNIGTGCSILIVTKVNKYCDYVFVSDTFPFRFMLE